MKDCNDYNELMGKYNKLMEKYDKLIDDENTLAKDIDAVEEYHYALLEKFAILTQVYEVLMQETCNKFNQILKDKGIDPGTYPPGTVDEKAIAKFVDELRDAARYTYEGVYD